MPFHAYNSVHIPFKFYYLIIILTFYTFSLICANETNRNYINLIEFIDIEHQNQTARRVLLLTAIDIYLFN